MDDLSISTKYFEEDGIHYVVCEEFDIVGYGKTREGAEEMTKEIMTDIAERGTLSAILQAKRL